MVGWLVVDGRLVGGRWSMDLIKPIKRGGGTNYDMVVIKVNLYCSSQFIGIFYGDIL